MIKIEITAKKEQGLNEKTKMEIKRRMKNKLRIQLLLFNIRNDEEN